MRRRALLAVAGALAAILAVTAVLGAGAPPDRGGVMAGPGPGAPGSGGVPGGATVPALAEGPLAGAPAGDADPPPASPAELRAAPPALVAGAGGVLVEAPSGLAGRGAVRRGSPALVPWERVAVAGRVTELGPLARPVARGLAAARGRMGPCFAEERRLLATGHEAPFDPADPPTGPAVLLLDLETRAGAVEVVTANVDALGTSTPELAACAVGLLTGASLPAPGAAPGRRFRLRQILQ